MSYGRCANWPPKQNGRSAGVSFPINLKAPLSPREGQLSSAGAGCAYVKRYLSLGTSASGRRPDDRSGHHGRAPPAVKGLVCADAGWWRAGDLLRTGHKGHHNALMVD